MASKPAELSRPRYTTAVGKDVKIRMRDGVASTPYTHYAAAYNTNGGNTVHTGGRMASCLLLPAIPAKP